MSKEQMIHDAAMEILRVGTKVTFFIHHWRSCAT